MYTTTQPTSRDTNLFGVGPMAACNPREDSQGFHQWLFLKGWSQRQSARVGAILRQSNNFLLAIIKSRHQPKLDMDMIIRNETDSDVEVISDVTKLAFENHPISNHTEQFIIKALRVANALTISLVAEVDGKVVAHIAFSPVTIPDGSQEWYGLGPISVLPKYQKQGIGKALMHEGLSRLKARGAQGCVLVGDPNYYEQFGFRSLPELTHEGVPQENVLALPFGENKAQGVVVFHQSFSVTG